VHVPRVFLFDARYAQHTPAAALARVMPHQLCQQPIAIEPTGLHVPQPPAYLDAGGVHDLVLDADAYQVPVQPAAIPARLVAAHHPGRSGQNPAGGAPRSLKTEPCGLLTLDK